MDTTPPPDGPQLSMDVHHRGTQLNLWMIVAILAFFILGGWYIAHVVHHPPVSTQQMKQSLDTNQDHWAEALC